MIDDTPSLIVNVIYVRTVLINQVEGLLITTETFTIPTISRLLILENCVAILEEHYLVGCKRLLRLDNVSNIDGAPIESLVRGEICLVSI